MGSSKSFRAGTASQSLADEAFDKVRDLRYGMQDMASRSMNAVTDTASAAQERLGRYAGATGRYVTEQPVKSALIAAAIGAAVAAIVMVARSRRQRSYYY